jgi:thiosulfate dehydrogenase
LAESFILRRNDVKKHLIATGFVIISVLMVISLLLVGCGASDSATTAPEQAAAPTTAPEPTTPPEPELAGDVVRGGLLYDQWWAVIETDAPTEDQPLWATQSTNTRSGADTWRCKECHGWDYKGVDGAYGSGSHQTGFAGVFASQDKPATEILAAMKGSTNPDHDFSTMMAEQDLVDLTVFMTEALIDTGTLVNADKTTGGDAAQGQTLYGEVCVKCHGPEGNAINFNTFEEPEFIGHLAPDNPWEFIHKVRFGQPGWPMPSGISNDWTDEDVVNTLAYAQSFTTESALSGGGQLYDQWWAVLGMDAPTDDQPLWATQSTNTRSGADTWRCKECHGWDYKGVDGAYGSGSHQTGFPGVLDAVSMSTEELLAWLDGSTNSDHDFSGVMDEVALNALATFIQTETTDTSPFINADKTVNGDPASGKALYDGTCASCHGVDGKKINFASEEEPEYVGTLAADNPWEFFHKASLGQPDAPMPVGRALGWSLEDIADLTAFAQTLPTE